MRPSTRCPIAWGLTALAAVALAGGGATLSHAQGLQLFVATNGNDEWSGRTDRPAAPEGPFATLERAREEIRGLRAAGALPAGGVTVEVLGGLYERTATFELGLEDSGTEAAPIVYRARPGEKVRLSGGRRVTGWQPVTDPAILQRLEESARGRVYQASLRDQGLTDLGDVNAADQRLELFFQDRPMQIARWPNEGFVKIAGLLSLDPVDVRGTVGDKVGKFIYEGDRPQRWTQENDLYLHGYWFWDWSDQREKVESIDTATHTITLAPPYHGYGYRVGQWYYAFNALAELDTPGEWCLDREAGILYFWPPAPLDQGTAVVSVASGLVKLTDASYVTLQGFTLEAARGTGVSISGGEGDQLVGCTIRNLAGAAAVINGGAHHAVIGCDISEVGDSGVSLNGGDRTTLTPAGHLAENNHIHHYGRWDRMYQPAIALSGVGNRAAHNLLDNAPHEAIAFSGNDQVMEYNEIHSVCYESNDAGAIYAGRDWTMRGTVIRDNYLHDITGFEGRGCVGVYLDDMYCGTTIADNLFHNVTMAAFIGGGRDNRIENNLFVDCRPAVHVDARAMGWAKYHADGWVQEGHDKGTLSGIAYSKPPYSVRYPVLPGILDDDPWAPKGNVILRNVCWGGRWDDIEPVARPMLTFQDNLLDQDPLFVDAANGNYQLREDSPAYRLGFQRLPIEQMGLYADSRRASWPVTTAVRPAPPPPPPPQAKTGPPPVFVVHRHPGAVTVDGMLVPEEWGGEGTPAMPVEQGINGEKVAPPSQAFVAYDDTSLLIAVLNEVASSDALRRGNKWGQDDAVEVAIRSTAAGDRAPIIVLRGFVTGHYESSGEAGAPAEVVTRAAQGVEYQAAVMGPTQWTCEWRIPFAALGVDPTKDKRLGFNLTVRKTTEALWAMWEGTRGYSWDLNNAGFLELQ